MNKRKRVECFEATLSSPQLFRPGWRTFCALTPRRIPKMVAQNLPSASLAHAIGVPSALDRCLAQHRVGRHQETSARDLRHMRFRFHLFLMGELSRTSQN